MNGDVFVDTNIFLYALTIPDSPSPLDLDKHEKELEFFKTTILDAESLVTSVLLHGINRVSFVPNIACRIGIRSWFHPLRKEVVHSL